MASHPTPPEDVTPAFDVRHFFRMLAARKRPIVLAAAIAAVGAGAVSVLQFALLSTPAYLSEATILAPSVPEELAQFTSTVNLPTEAGVLKSPLIGGRALEALQDDPATARTLREFDLTSPTKLSKQLRVNVIPQTQLLHLEYLAAEADLAPAVLRAFIESYVDFRQNQVTRAALTGRRLIQNQIRDVQPRLRAVERRLSRARKARDRTFVDTLESQRDIIILRLASLQQRLTELQPQAASLSAAKVVDPPTTPSSSPLTILVNKFLFGAAIGLVLVIGWFLLMEFLKDRFHKGREVETVLGAPILASLVPLDAENQGRQMSPESSTVGSTAEIFRSLGAKLDFVMKRKGIKTIVVTSPLEGEGSTSTTANLGFVLAQAGRRVALISGDLRASSLHHLGGLPARTLRALLQEANGERGQAVDARLANVTVAMSDPMDDPGVLLNADRLRDFVRGLEEDYEFVLLDCPPLLSRADTMLIISAIPTVLLVLEPSVSTREVAAEARREIENVGGSIIGCIIGSADQAMLAGTQSAQKASVAPRSPEHEAARRS